MDGSNLSDKAFVRALDLAKFVGGEITIIHVFVTKIQLPRMMDRPEISSMIALLKKEERGQLDSMIADYFRRGEEAGIGMRSMVPKGNPAEEIIREAKNHDIVIIGSMGHNDESDFLLGSTAEKVARYAHCTVMLVREGE